MERAGRVSSSAVLPQGIGIAAGIAIGTAGVVAGISASVSPSAGATAQRLHPSLNRALIGRPSLRVAPTVVAAGARVRVYGNADGCPRGDTVYALSRAFSGPAYAGLGAVKAPVRAGGRFSATGRIRRDAKPGRYVVSARCGGGNLGVTARLRVI